MGDDVAKSSEMPQEINSLLFVTGNATVQESPNMRSRLSAACRTGQYLSLAQRLGRSLNRNLGLRLRLLTNHESRLREMIRARVVVEPSFQPSFDIISIPFEQGIPGSSEFFAATHKIYAFRYFSSRRVYSILVDLDLLSARPLGDVVRRLMADQRPLVLDMTSDSFAEVGRERVERDLSIVAGRRVESPRWFGGEFIAGGHEFFGALFEAVQSIVDQYRHVYSGLFHQGDEMLVSAALSSSRAIQELVVDLSDSEVIERLWLVQRLGERRRMRRPNCALLHVPALKPLLDSSLSDEWLLRLVSVLDRCPGTVVRKLIRVGAMCFGRSGRGWE